MLLSQDSAYDPEALYERGVHVIHYPVASFDVDVLAQAFDAIVWGGGALLDDQQYDDRPRNVSTGNLFIRLSETALAAGKRVYACGLSTNEALSSTTYLARLQRIIASSSWFSLRDARSYEVLANAGLDMAKVTRCEDIVFGNEELASLERVSPDHMVIGMVALYIPEMYEVTLAVLNAALSEIRQDERGVSL